MGNWVEEERDRVIERNNYTKMGNAFAEKGAVCEDFITKAKVVCRECGDEALVLVRDSWYSLPSCGLVEMTCTKCGWDYYFGE